MSDDDLLRSAKLISRDYVNNTYGFNAAAVLLLGKDLVIQNIFPAYKTEGFVDLTVELFSIETVRKFHFDTGQYPPVVAAVNDGGSLRNQFPEVGRQYH